MTDEPLIECDASIPECIPISREPLPRGADGLHITQIRHPSVAPLQQMADPGPGTVTIRREHRVRIQERGRPIDEHHGKASSTIVQEVALVGARGDDDETVNPPRHECSRQLTFALRVLVQTRCEHGDTSPARGVLDGSMDGRGERIGHILQQQPDLGDCCEIAAALERLLSDKELSVAMGKAARKRAVTYFDIDYTIRRYMNLFKDILERKGVC